MKKECTIEGVLNMLTEIVAGVNCPLCGARIYSSYSLGFENKHLPFIEDDGNAITAGIICGNANSQKLTLLRCVKESGRVSDKTEIY